MTSSNAKCEMCLALNVPNIVVGVRNETPLEIWIWRDNNYHTINHPSRMGMEIPLTDDGINPTILEQYLVSLCCSCSYFWATHTDHHQFNFRHWADFVRVDGMAWTI